MKTSPRQALPIETASFAGLWGAMTESMTRAQVNRFLKECPPIWLPLIETLWPINARADQMPPSGEWLIWLLMGGRGSGKTRSGAEWVREQVLYGGKRRVALIAPTLGDARDVMIGGESGLSNIGLPAERPRFLSSLGRLEWPNGAMGHVFSAQEPDSLRGPQFDCAWADEFCAWKYPDAALSNLRLALRLGSAPRLVMTTTPKPIAALRALLDNPAVSVSRASTRDNAMNLASGFMAAMDEAYGGTRIGRQELEGDFLDDNPGGLWQHAQFDALRITEIPPLSKLIIAVDPPITSSDKSDSCGLIVAGLLTVSGSEKKQRPKAIILQDATVQGLSPQGWAKRVAGLYTRWSANYVLAEVNQGGEMVTTILRSVDPDIAVRTVYASRAKSARAEPVAALYEQGRVLHVGQFPDLEDELCRLGSPEFSKSNSKSPDRADALVWAVTELLIRPRDAHIGVRQI